MNLLVRNSLLRLALGPFGGVYWEKRTRKDLLNVFNPHLKTGATKHSLNLPLFCQNMNFDQTSPCLLRVIGIYLNSAHFYFFSIFCPKFSKTYLEQGYNHV